MKKLTIANVTISQNENGLYSLTDLHKANGGGANKAPSQFLRTKRVQRLISELESVRSTPEVLNITDGTYGGTFGSVHVLIAYAEYLATKIGMETVAAFIAEPEKKPLSLAEELKILLRDGFI